MMKEIYSFDEYEAFIKEISGDEEYYDPHFNHSPNNLYGILQSEQEMAFVSEDDGRVNGLFGWMISPEDKNVELIIGFTREERAFEDMLTLIEQRFPGYQVDLIFSPKNQAIRNVAKRKQADFEPEVQKMVHIRDVSDVDTSMIQEYAPKWRTQYCEIHPKNVFWTAEKVIAAPERFRILLAMKEDTVVGYLDVTNCFEENEIYGIYVKPEFRGLGYEKALLVKAAEVNQADGLMYLAEVENKQEIAALMEAGFEKHEGFNSVYCGYQIA
ncbi:Acetyltransferase (GNAT) domain-containing protein [Lachnospiraceae bacterium XBB1006]|nr:Acetyltransferase (GNAT) domain-containing protein [Lachnospiraceae bacterium XBB1006]